MLRFLVAFLALCTLCNGQGNPPSTEQRTLSHPIKIAGLAKYINESESIILNEFKNLGPPEKPLKPWVESEIPENLVKHRYHSGEDVLLTYDHTRVILDTLPGQPHSDFIAANWVDS